MGLDTAMPPVCLGCAEPVLGQDNPFSAPVPNHHGLCARCWNDAKFCGHAVCNRCGVDMLEGADGLTCVACIQSPPQFDHARAVWFYDGVIRDMTLRFKHADATHFAPSLAHYMMPVWAKMLENRGVYDVIVPVPLHWKRLVSRQYNQSSLLAQGLGKLTGIPVLPNHLRRIKPTLNQGKFGRAGRYKNVRGAFDYAPDTLARWAERWQGGNRGDLSGKSVLLVDDVMTTGATVNQCATILKRHGAVSVDVITLCRALRHKAEFGDVVLEKIQSIENNA